MDLPRAAASSSASSSMSSSVVHLDPNIRNWVLIPITIAMFLVGTLRHQVSRLTKTVAKADVAALREANVAQRAERTRGQAGYLRRGAYEARKEYYCGEEKGLLRQKSEKPNAQAQMLSDPTMMTSMMTKNLTMIVPNMLTAAWVNFFFTGFVVGRTPFPLTQRFRGMLQRGVALKGLDVTYVSALSWYFLNFFGLGGLFQLCLGNNELDDTAAMQNAFASGLNTDKAFAMAREGLEMLQHEHMMHVADGRATKILKALNAGKSEREARMAASRG